MNMQSPFEKLRSRPRPEHRLKPRLIIHGGAGHITPSNLPPAQWSHYKQELLRIYAAGYKMLVDQGGSAVDVASHAVRMMEDEEAWNCGRGAVFTSDGTNELEASIMTTTTGYTKRTSAVSLLKHVKNPILLAKQILLRGETDMREHTGAQGHVHLSGPTAEQLARDWGMETVEQSYFWTRRRWEQHRRGLQRAGSRDSDAYLELNEESTPCDETQWTLLEYLPQGTVGAVALDRYGTICVATSTGGLTNKLPGRIGDTPSVGAGFWAEQWTQQPPPPPLTYLPHGNREREDGLQELVAQNARKLIRDVLCLPYNDNQDEYDYDEKAPLASDQGRSDVHAVAVSGTGNGDSFLRLSACRTVGAITRFCPGQQQSLSSAVHQIVGPGGEMQRAAGDRWGDGSGEGEGGMIGIELRRGKGEVVWDFNCGGMFRCWADEHGTVRVGVFRDGEDEDGKLHEVLKTKDI